MKAKVLKQGEIYRYQRGTKVRIKDSVQCHPMYHEGGILIFQSRDEVEDGEYRVGMEVGDGVCFDFHPDMYELVK